MLLLPALLVLLLCLAMASAVLTFAPPLVSAVAGVLLLVVLVWFVLVRRRGAGIASEASLIGRQSSKDGLL